MNFRTNPCASTFALAAMLASAPALAQDQVATSASAETKTDDTGTDIVVTAQFRQQRLQDTPLAITALNSAAIDARDLSNVIDVGNFSPNVKITETPSYYGNSVTAFIRGVGQNDSSFALEPGVGMYIDDVYYGTTFGAVFDLNDLERVEILRGPQGTLAGKNSVGGSIKLFTPKPTGSGDGYVEATYGRFNRLEVRGGVDVALAEGLYARISGLSRHTDGYVTRMDFGCANPAGGIPARPTTGADCKTGTEGGKDVQALRVAMRYAPTGSPVEINVVGDVADDSSEPTATKLVYANNPNFRTYVAGNPFAGVPFDSRFLTGPKSYTNYSTYSNGGNFTTVFGFPYQVAPGGFVATPQSTSRSWGISATVDVTLADQLSLKSITAYREATGLSSSDFDASPITIQLQSLRFSHRQFTQELRLNGKIGEGIAYTIGGFYYDARDRLSARIEIPDTMFDFLSNDPVSNRSASAFAHVEAQLFPSMRLIGGIRYTHDEKTYTFSRRNPDGSAITGPDFSQFPPVFPPNFAILGLDGVQGGYRQGRVDYRIGLDYRWSDALLTYVQVSTGFKGGGINPRPYVPDQVLSFSPETVTAYEAGFKIDAGRLLRLNGALFFNNYRNMQLALFTCPFSSNLQCSAPSNAGQAHVKGAELEWSLRPGHGVTIDGSVGYIDFDYQSVNPLTLIKKEMRAPFVSKWQAAAGIQYEADLGGSGSLTPRIDWTYQSDYYARAVNNPQNLVAGRSLVQARLTYETKDGDWSASAGVTNLFNKFYYFGVDESVAAYGMVTGYVGRPREWSVSLRRNF